MPDPTAVADRLAFVERWTAAFAALDPSTLDRDDAIDRDIILAELAAQRFGDEDLQEERWNPLDWVYLLGEGLFLLLVARVRPARRIGWRASPVGWRGCPPLLDGARDALVGTDDGRPVGRFQTETALDQLPRRRRADRRRHRRSGRGGGRPVRGRAVRPRLSAAAATAQAALGGVRDAPA